MSRKNILSYFKAIPSEKDDYYILEVSGTQSADFSGNSLLHPQEEDVNPPRNFVQNAEWQGQDILVEFPEHATNHDTYGTAVDVECYGEPPSKHKVFSQKFRHWINSVKFACFEAYKKDAYYAWCRICLDKLSVARGGKSNLATHIKTKRHIEASSKIVLEDDNIIDNVMNSTISKQTAEAELKICSWAIENNVSFAAVDKLTDLLKNVDIDSKVLSKLKLGRTKTTSVIKGVLALEQHSQVIKMMNNKKFSLLIDESTDITTNKTLAMVIRLMMDEAEKFEVSDIFYKAIELNAGDHRTIYHAIVHEFENDNIEYKKQLIGFASDGASVMMGSENSVMKLLKNDCPHLIAIKCTCHSLALCVSYACAKIPSYLEHLLKDIYNYISTSSKRLSQFAMIQDILELKPLKMLHPSATRWLSLEAVVKRVLDRYDELKVFFGFQYNFDRNTTAKRILTHLTDEMSKPFLQFLDYILPIINKLNRLFQSESPEFSMIYNEMKTLHMLLLSNICEDAALEQFPMSDTNFERYLTKNVYVGVAATESINVNVNENIRKTFLECCSNFYVELIKQITKRFDLNDPVLKVASSINPKNLVELKLVPLFEQFHGLYEPCDKQKLENELREIQMKIRCQIIRIEQSDSTVECWKKLLLIKRADQQFAFPCMRRLISNILVIPHSTAAVERCFSQYNLNKTKVRNRLNMDTIDGILKSKWLIKAAGGSRNMKLTRSIKEKYCKEMYQPHCTK